MFTAVIPGRRSTEWLYRRCSWVVADDRERLMIIKDFGSD